MMCKIEHKNNCNSGLIKGLLDVMDNNKIFTQARFGSETGKYKLTDITNEDSYLCIDESNGPYFHIAVGDTHVIASDGDNTYVIDIENNVKYELGIIQSGDICALSKSTYMTEAGSNKGLIAVLRYSEITIYSVNETGGIIEEIVLRDIRDIDNIESINICHQKDNDFTLLLVYNNGIAYISNTINLYNKTEVMFEDITYALSPIVSNGDLLNMVLSYTDNSDDDEPKALHYNLGIDVVVYKTSDNTDSSFYIWETYLGCSEVDGLLYVHHNESYSLQTVKIQ